MTRPIKRNKTKLENLIMKTWYDTNKGTIIKETGQGSIVDAIKSTLWYFEMEDYLYGSRHADIFRKIYLLARYERSISKSKKKKRIIIMTQVAFAEKFNIDVRTLRGYLNIYIQCFEKNLKDIAKKE